MIKLRTILLICCASICILSLSRSAMHVIIHGKNIQEYLQPRTDQSTQAPVNNLTIAPQNLSTCPLVSPHIGGLRIISGDILSFESLASRYPDVDMGGRYHPSECKSHHKVALVVPYRDRDIHLQIFLNNLHAFLQRQQCNYGIYLIEQVGNSSFNRAMLINIGFVEILQREDFPCFIFHDVDLIPEDDRNTYQCRENPLHLAAGRNKTGYKLNYPGYFGGVTAISQKQFAEINGFSNIYWGWGSEDDDLHKRVLNAGMKVLRYPIKIARYSMLPHHQAKENMNRRILVKAALNRRAVDGLNSLSYKLLDVKIEKLYTKFLVSLPTPNTT